MLQLVVFLTGCLFVATVHAACKVGPFSAKESLGGPGGSGVYKLVKSTFQNEEECVYVGPPQTVPSKGNPATYNWGWKKNGAWQKTTGKVYGEGANIMDEDSVYGKTTTTLVYSDYGNCDVTLFNGDKVTGGPHVELWQHSGANPNSEAVQCCKNKFNEELGKQNKGSSSVKEIDTGCGTYPQ
uniref:Putative salivary secreted lipocalin n=1 Tax=Ornithodoros turicata TaxID=34597 RepID=A0A2R5LP38_9ACAR